MKQDPCTELRKQMEAALGELERVSADEAQTPSTTGTVQRNTPPMGGDLGSRFYETVGQREAADRRYRSAVRTLSECLRQHQDRPGVIDSSHE